MTVTISFGQWLKQRRKMLDLTQEELAARIGCAAVTLYKLEKNERRPSKQMAELLADHLAIPPAERNTFIRFARSDAIASLELWGTSFHPPTNLFAPSTVLIGRDVEIAAIRKRLHQADLRLLTLTGPPGIGKTRLAQHVAAAVLDDFPDGVLFVALAPITDATLVPTTLVSVLGLRDIGPQPPLERLKTYLRDKQLLLLLDNVEQIPAAAPYIAELLAVCPFVKFLVTSRAPLGIRMERQFPVSALELPDLAQVLDVEAMTRYPAIMLFIERAQAVKPDFVLTSDNAPTVAAICSQLDGLPLAIELISARIKMLPPAMLLEHLHGRLLLQSVGMHDLEPRHRTLNAAIDWSYQLLTADEQILFRRLGVFVGGCKLEAIEVVCVDGLSLPILDGLASLLDKNLLKQDARLDGEPRFTLLETIREYALGCAADSGESDELRQCHADYFTNFVDRTAKLYRVDYGRWLNSLDAELANFRAALAWSDTGLGLALALRMFWLRRRHLSEGRDWIVTGLARQEFSLTTRPPTRGDLFSRASANRWLAIFSTFLGDFETAQPRYEESLTLFQELGERGLTADVLGELGMLLQEQGDYVRAAALMEESLTIQHQVGDEYEFAFALYYRGTLAYTQGNAHQARTLWEESLINFRPSKHSGRTWGMANVLAHLAMVSVDVGDFAQATVFLAESLRLLRELDERWQTIHALEVSARLAAEQSQPSEATQSVLLRAARLFGAAETLRETLRAPVLSFQQPSYERGLASLRAKLDTASLIAAWSEGRAMTFDQAISYALGT